MTTIQTINIGNVVNDGLGDDLRSAFEKVNNNFTELYHALTITGQNVGGTGYGVYKQQVGNILEFKTLVSGRYMQLQEHDNTIVFDSTVPVCFRNIETTSGTVNAGSYDGDVTFQGGPDIDITSLGSTVTVNTHLPVTKMLTTFDFGPLSSHYADPIQLLLAGSNIEFGTFTLPSNIDLDCGTITNPLFPL